MLWAGCWLALFLVTAKALSGDIPWWPNLPARLLTLVASSWRDVFFALICGALGELVARVFRSHRSARIVRTGFLFFYTACAFYAVGAIGVFRYFNRPLTYDLFGLIGNAAAVRSSIMERLTWPMAIALVVGPALYLFPATRRTRSRQSVGVACAVAIAWIGGGWLLQRSGWENEKLEFLALSPHLELLRTTARGLTGGARPSFPKDFPPEYVNEFRTFGARPSAAGPFFLIPPGVTRPRNAIVLVLESVGTKYLALYGAPGEVTPTLTAEAKHALVFENIYAHAGFTYASFRPINFSVYPGLPWHYALLEDGRPLPETLAAKLKRRGTRTAYITNGDLDWGDQRWLLEKPDKFDLLQGASDLGCTLLSSWGSEDRCAIDRLIEWINQAPDQPFFAICWTDQTHDPYLSGKGDQVRAMSDFERYLAVLEETDAQLGRLFAELRARGLADDTIVIVTGDHGEAFGEWHGQRGHAWSVYEEETHVPFMIWNPRLFPEGGRVETIGGHVDLNPTLADLLGVIPPREWQGHSLFDPARPPRAYFMAIAGGSVFGVREGAWKYIFDVTRGRESLFHLASDPQEQRDLSATEPARANELRQRVAAWVTFEEAFLWGREN